MVWEAYPAGVGVSVPLRGQGRDQLGHRGFNVVPDSRFPSPCGEKVGINAFCTSLVWDKQHVSVPLRGKGRDQRWKRFGPGMDLIYEVSVPLRGKGRDQRHFWVSLRTELNCYKFPSPCGEKVGINVSVSLSKPFGLKGFRPLAGKR